jgi:Ca-activated chloride channel family protein
LKGEAYLKKFSYDEAIAQAESGKGADKFGYRAEFINLIRAAKNAPALPVQLQ